MTLRSLIICDSCETEAPAETLGWFAVFRSGDETEMDLTWDFCSDSCLMSFAAEIILADELKIMGDE